MTPGRTRRLRHEGDEWQYVEVSRSTGRVLRVLCRAERKDWCENQAKGFETAEASKRFLAGLPR
jgi:hypothetical protein